MNTTLLLNKARKEVDHAKTQAAADARAAQLALEVARAAKIKLKHARKLSKMAKKSARKAEDKSEESTQMLDNARARLEKLEKRIRKKQRKNRPVRKSKPDNTAFLKLKHIRGDDKVPRKQAKSRTKKAAKSATPRVFASRTLPKSKPTVRKASATHGPKPKHADVKAAQPNSTAAPSSTPMTAVSRKPLGQNPMPGPNIDVPLATGTKSTGD